MWTLIITGIVVHIMLLIAIFDIYFVSPIDHGLVSHKSTAISLAKRVVLIVADRLPAEILYKDEMSSNAPFLHSVKETRGTWGISHTQVSTVSRSGHSSILAGIYENPTAILVKSWSNPVDFDSVIKQSNNAWCWGRPDIVDMYNKDGLSHIHMEPYDTKFEAFFRKSSTAFFDECVFDKVDSFLKQQQKRSSCTDFCEDGNIFFLNLLGIDTFKSHSSQYIDNIKIVDSGVEKLEQSFEDFFKDNSTAYIFTAGYDGKTGWGSPHTRFVHDTESPIIAWGAGVPRSSNKSDVKQADIAPLLSSLIGKNIPVHSIGVVPITYINGTKQQNANILASNARQLAEQYNMKRLKQKHNTISLFYRPFRALTQNSLNNLLESIEHYLRLKQYEAVAQQSDKLIKLSLEGIKYFHTYHQSLLLFCVSCGFFGWIAYVFIFIFSAREKATTSAGIWLESKISVTLTSIRTVLVMTTLPVCCLLYVQSLPWMYYIYCTFPLIMWWAVMREAHGIIFMYLFLKHVGIFHSFFICVMYLLGTELLVCSFFHRRAMTCLMLLIACSVFFEDEKINGITKDHWMIYCMILAVFSMIPDGYTCFTHQLFSSAAFNWGVITYWIIKNISEPCDGGWIKNMIICQVTIFHTSLVNVFLITFIIGMSEIPFTNQLISWVVFAVSLLMPLMSSKLILPKLTSIVMSLMSIYMLMSDYIEGLFMAFFVILLYRWIKMEHMMGDNQIKLERIEFDGIFNIKTIIDRHDFRRGLLFLTFIMLAFLCTGNIGSLNYFHPAHTRCFVTVFCQFTTTGLTVVKIIIPFLLVTCAFRAINIITNGNTSSMFTIVLFFCDILVVNFLFLIKNEGSWLEIVMSISHFIIVDVSMIFLLILYYIAYILTSAKRMRKTSNKRIHHL